ncbi:MAG: hypothetical protein ACRENB_10705 [Gemmatimonadales bacterium]
MSLALLAGLLVACGGAESTPAITDPEIPLQGYALELAILPRTVTLLRGDAAQFVAYGQYSDGSSEPVPVNWTTTGGSIDGSGLFRAGGAGSIALVVAQQTGGHHLADTALVSIVDSASAPPPPPDPEIPGAFHEPGGLTPFNTRSFNSIAANESDRIGSEGWDPVEARWRTFSIVRDTTAPLSSASVVETRFPAGMIGGVSPGVMQHFWPQSRGTRELYHRFAFKLSDNFFGHPTSTNKLFHIWVGGQNRAFSRVVGAGTGGMTFQMALQGVPDQRTRFPANTGVGPTTVVRGRWYLVEVYLRLNTPGVPDGVIDTWVDGVHTGHYTDVLFLGSTEGWMTWHQIQWSATWGGGGSNVPADQFIWLDHSYASAR